MKKILVVEDSLLQGEKLKDLLTFHDFEADLCEAGTSAHEKLGREDYDMIETAVRNLLSNAKKFTKKGGSITITSNSVNTADEKFHKLSIRDTGQGMTDLALDNLFSVTYQKATEDTEGNIGMGLGLSIVKDFIEKNAGEVKVKSKLGEGSAFSLYLPAVE